MTGLKTRGTLTETQYNELLRERYQNTLEVTDGEERQEAYNKDVLRILKAFTDELEILNKYPRADLNYRTKAGQRKKRIESNREHLYLSGLGVATYSRRRLARAMNMTGRELTEFIKETLDKYNYSPVG